MAHHVQLWARIAQYASDEEIDWAPPKDVPPNPISKDEDDEQVDEELEVRQEAQEHVPSTVADPTSAQSPHVNRALFEDHEDDILAGTYVFSSQVASQVSMPLGSAMDLLHHVDQG
ncbi:unnamed protein product [Calypogeia fissa]